MKHDEEPGVTRGDRSDQVRLESGRGGVKSKRGTRSLSGSLQGQWGRHNGGGEHMEEGAGVKPDRTGRGVVSKKYKIGR